MSCDEMQSYVFHYVSELCKVNSLNNWTNLKVKILGRIVYQGDDHTANISEDPGVDEHLNVADGIYERRNKAIGSNGDKLSEMKTTRPASERAVSSGNAFLGSLGKYSENSSTLFCPRNISASISARDENNEENRCNASCSALKRLSLGGLDDNNMSFFNDTEIGLLDDTNDLLKCCDVVSHETYKISDKDSALTNSAAGKKQKNLLSQRRCIATLYSVREPGGPFELMVSFSVNIDGKSLLLPRIYVTFFAQNRALSSNCCT